MRREYECPFGFRASGFFRVSAFGLRIFLCSSVLFAFNRNFAGANSAHEDFVVALALIGIGFSKLNQSLIEALSLTDIPTQLWGVTCLGMSTCQSPAAHFSKIIKYLALQIFEPDR